MFARNSQVGLKSPVSQVISDFPEETLSIVRALLEEAVIDTSFDKDATPKQWLMMPLSPETLAALELLKGHFNGGKEP
ncbi:hypothetical protein [Kiloniella sp.]|uniref:hypothetical protein n=1 Tax=Kiloniella sp. TaxID=1938587 RepID=UPI003B0286B6